MVNLGIIGAGQWGLNYVRVFSELEGARVRMVCDARPGRLDLVAKRWSSLELTVKVEDVVSAPGIDAVVVAVPPSGHYEVAMEALRKGKHVLVEKPLATRSAHARGLVEMAQRARKTLMVGHVFCFNPGVRAVRKLIQDGALGEIHYVHSTRTNLGPIRDDVDALWDLAPHDISILLYLLGESPISVSANGGSFLRPDVADVAFAVFRFPSGVVASLQVSWIDPRKVRQVTVVGSNKMAVFDDLDTVEPVRVYDKGVDGGIPYSSFGEFRFLLRSGDILAPRVPALEPLKTQCQHFLDCVESGAVPIADARQGLAVCTALEAASRSMSQKGCSVEVER